MTQPSLREGDVLQYEPGNKHGREGLALVRRSPTHLSGYAAPDTYWQHAPLDRDLGDGHTLTDAELASAVVLFNVADYVRIRKPERDALEHWRRYRPEDRATVTAQHGGRVVYLVKRDAVERRGDLAA